MNIECPDCGFDIKLNTEDLPERACDEVEIECGTCRCLIIVGWYPVAEIKE